ncbi:MAG: hypothetical protein ABW178_10155 [Pseudoxanthomonas sp.]
MNTKSIAMLCLLTLLCAGLPACRNEPVPAEQKPDPKATELHQAIQAPLDRARAAEQATQQAAEKQKAAINAASQ